MVKVQPSNDDPADPKGNLSIDVSGEITREKSRRFKKNLVFSSHSFNRKILFSDIPVGMIPKSSITAHWTPSTRNLRVDLQGHEGNRVIPFEKRIPITTGK